MSISPELLLTLTPEEALRRQIAEVLKKPLSGTDVELGEVSVVSGTLTSIPVRIDRSIAAVELWKIRGTVDFEFHRLDMTDFTEGLPDTVRVDLPATFSSVWRQYLSHAGINVSDKDMEDNYVTSSGPYDIYADEGSLRWIGRKRLVVIQNSLSLSRVFIENKVVPELDDDWSTEVALDQVVSILNDLNSPRIKWPLVSDQVEVAYAPLGRYTDEFNTVMVVTPKPTFIPYLESGPLSVYTRRREFEKSFTNPIPVSFKRVTNTKQFYTALSAALGCTVHHTDLASVEIQPILIGSTRKIKVDFDPTSPAYIGSVWIDYTRTE